MQSLKFINLVRVNNCRFVSHINLWPTLKNPFIEEIQKSEIKFDKSNYQYKYKTSVDLFSRVNKYLPLKCIPKPPILAEGKSTAGGWIGPCPSKYQHLSYRVSRNKNHNLPVYTKSVYRFRLEKASGKRDLTLIRKITGNIWDLANELKQYLEPIIDGPCIMQVHQPACYIKVNGMYQEEVCRFLLEKGF